MAFFKKPETSMNTIFTPSLRNADQTASAIQTIAKIKKLNNNTPL